MPSIIPLQHKPTDDIYIDAGANLGRTVMSYYNKHKPAHIYAFEPNTAMFRHKNWKTVLASCKNVTLYRRAVWKDDSVMSLYIDPKPKSKGSTMYKSKRNLSSKADTMTVKCIDFAAFVSSLNGKVTIKLNIEGAEYTVLDHMITCNSLSNVERMIVAFHSHKIPKLDAIHKTVFSKLSETFDIQLSPGYKNKYDMHRKKDV